MRAWQAVRGFLRGERGEGGASLKAAIGILLLLVAYMAYPQPFHDFGRFAIDLVQESARDAFGTSSDGGAKDPGQIRIKRHSGGR